MAELEHWLVLGLCLVTQRWGSEKGERKMREGRRESDGETEGGGRKKEEVEKEKG